MLSSIRTFIKSPLQYYRARIKHTKAWNTSAINHAFETPSQRFRLHGYLEPKNETKLSKFLMPRYACHLPPVDPRDQNSQGQAQAQLEFKKFIHFMCCEITHLLSKPEPHVLGIHVFQEFLLMPALPLTEAELSELVKMLSHITSRAQSEAILILPTIPVLDSASTHRNPKMPYTLRFVNVLMKIHSHQPTEFYLSTKKKHALFDDPFRRPGCFTLYKEKPTPSEAHTLMAKHLLGVWLDEKIHLLTPTYSLKGQLQQESLTLTCPELYQNLKQIKFCSRNLLIYQQNISTNAWKTLLSITAKQTLGKRCIFGLDELPTLNPYIRRTVPGIHRALNRLSQDECCLGLQKLQEDPFILGAGLEYDPNFIEFPLKNSKEILVLMLDVCITHPLQHVQQSILGWLTNISDEKFETIISGQSQYRFLYVISSNSVKFESNSAPTPFTFQVDAKYRARIWRTKASKLIFTPLTRKKVSPQGIEHASSNLYKLNEKTFQLKPELIEIARQERANIHHNNPRRRG